MAEFIECRDCDSRSCTGCNTYILSQMLHAGKLDGIMDEHHTILAADVAPVVRCKDCKHFLEKGGILEPWCDRHEARLFCGDGFCSDGERKDGEG